MRSRLGTKSRLAAHLTSLALLILMLVYLTTPAKPPIPAPVPPAPVAPPPVTEAITPVEPIHPAVPPAATAQPEPVQEPLGISPQPGLPVGPSTVIEPVIAPTVPVVPPAPPGGLRPPEPDQPAAPVPEPEPEPVVEEPPVLSEPTPPVEPDPVPPAPEESAEPVVEQAETDPTPPAEEIDAEPETAPEPPATIAPFAAPVSVDTNLPEDPIAEEEQDDLIQDVIDTALDIHPSEPVEHIIEDPMPDLDTPDQPDSAAEVDEPSDMAVPPEEEIIEEETEQAPEEPAAAQPDESGSLVVAEPADADSPVPAVTPLPANANLEVLGDGVYWLDSDHDIVKELAAIPEAGTLILLAPLPGYRAQGLSHVRTEVIPADTADLTTDAAEQFVHLTGTAVKPVVVAAIPGARGAAFFKGMYLLTHRNLPLEEMLAEIEPDLEEAGPARDDVIHRLRRIEADGLQGL